MSQDNQFQNQIRDVDRIIEAVRQAFPDVVVDQLKVTYPADDDGLWYFHLQRSPKMTFKLNLLTGTARS